MLRDSDGSKLYTPKTWKQQEAAARNKRPGPALPRFGCEVAKLGLMFMVILFSNLPY